MTSWSRVKIPRVDDVKEIGGRSKSQLAAMSPAEFRGMVRRGEWTDLTVFACDGYVITNLAIVPKEYAFEFLLFCNRNPRPCPVLDVTEPGDPHPKLLAPEADVRTDLPKYRVYQDGKLIDEPTDITKYWRDDLVAFFIGCSLMIDFGLRGANVNYRMAGAFISKIPCIPAGRFHSDRMAVSCRVFKSSHDAVRAVQISSRLLAAHGYPVHIGDWASIGIRDFNEPEIAPRGELPPEPGEVAMFWGEGNTPQLAAMESKTPFLISHFPGYMFVGDQRIEELANL